MQYFKNADLTKMYPISEKAVRNWIASAKEGKLALALHEKDGKTYIANSAQNAATIDRLVSERKKYVNTKARKIVKPSEEFYQVYSREQIFDIITQLEASGELPLKYSYLDVGAKYWDDHTKKLAGEDVPNILNRTVDLLETNTDYLLKYLQDYSRVNVVDIGPGNGQPVKRFLTRLQEQRNLGRYIGIDISQNMLNILQNNMTNWFGSNFPFEGHVKDVAHDRFMDVLGEDAVGAEGDTVCNLVFLLGGTLFNFRSSSDVLRLIYNSLGPNDLLICSLKLDSDTAKRYFNFFNAETEKEKESVPSKNQISNFTHKLTLDYLNVDSSMYDIEQFFDEAENCRVIQIRLKSAVTVEFNINGFLRKVNFNKGDAIVLWRYKHPTATDLLDQLHNCGFSLLQTSQSNDHEYILTISEVKSK